MDTYVKIVLTVIAACLLLQVAQGFGLLGAPGCGQTSLSGPEATGQYLVQSNPRARILLRLDSATGRTWTMPLQPQQGRFWTEVAESPPQPQAREKGEETPSQPAEAGVTEE